MTKIHDYSLYNRILLDNIEYMKKFGSEPTPRAVEKRFLALAEKYHLQNTVTIEDIKKRIYEAGDVEFRKDHVKFFEWATGLFAEAKSSDDMNEVMRLFSDAWNVFPHKALDGKSPMDMLTLHEKSRMGEASVNMIGVFTESIKKLYLMARVRAQRELKRIGGTQQEFMVLENALQKIGTTENAMLRILFAIGKRTNRMSTEWFEPFAREYQAMTNHQILPGDGDFIGSPYLFEILQTAPEMKRDPAQVFGMIEYTLATHEAIDACGKEHELHQHMVSIAHHAFDWLMMTRPTDIMLDESTTNALIMYAIVARIQKAVTGQNEIAEDMFAKHIYPAERKIFTERVSELVPVLLCEAHDPHMLLVDAKSAPDDWLARLHTIAPNMHGVPSPFYP